MKHQYIVDMSKPSAPGKLKIYPLSDQYDIVSGGVTIRSYPICVKEEDKQRCKYFKEKQGVQFIFEDCIPEINFYSVPSVEIFAVDFSGGYFGMISPFCIAEGPICYINSNRTCYIIADDYNSFYELLLQPNDWREKMVITDEIQFYDSKQDAENQGITFIS